MRERNNKTKVIKTSSDKNVIVREDLTNIIENFIAELQADYLVEHPEIIGLEKEDRPYLTYMKFVTQQTSDYLGSIATMYKYMLDNPTYKNTSTQERIDRITGVKK